jgi:hypothetical protein
MFLTPEELFTLTGYKMRRQQIAQLKRMGIAFWLNASGRPVVASAMFQGSDKMAPPPTKTWEPSWGANRH